MDSRSQGDEEQFVAIVNEEGQYSFWPSYKRAPRGWTQVFGPDTRSACLDYIERTWTDLRPLSEIRRTQAMNDEASGG